MSEEIKVKVHSYGPGRPLSLVYFDPISGKKKAKSSGTTDWREAERLAGELQKELEAGRYAPPSKITWADFRKRCEVERLAAQSVSTRKATGTAFNVVERVLQPDRLCKLTTGAMSKMIATLRTEKVRESTLACYLRHLKATLRWAKKMGFLSAVPEFDMPAAGEAKARPVTTEEFERMLAAVPKVRKRDSKAWADLLEGLWLSGLRLSEALRLSWDPDAPFAVSLSGRFPAFAIEALAQKGRRDERLPMTPDFARWLLDNTPEAERVGVVFKLPSLRNGPDGKPIGKPVGLAKVTFTLSKIGKAAGVVVATADKQVKDKGTGEKSTVAVKKFASAHDLRWAFGTRWARKVMPAVLQRLMRHTDIATTMKFYVSIEADDVAAQLWGLEDAAGNTFGNNRPAATSKTAGTMPAEVEAKPSSEATCDGEASEGRAQQKIMVRRSIVIP